LGASAAIPFNIALVLLSCWMMLARRDAVRFAALSVVAFVVVAKWAPGARVIETSRSFFGVHQISENIEGTHRLLRHGTTLHGVERIAASNARPDSRPEPLAYYYLGGPIAEGIAAARAAHGHLDRVAVVGLGAGALACHASGSETWTFYEIDPEVVRLARDPNLFTFLTRCAPSSPIILGDARLTLTRSQQQYDLIVLDAFSSDAIPAHLLTREALRSYAARLSPHGTILLHISNRHLDLAPVLAAVAAAEGFSAFVKTEVRTEKFEASYKMSAQVAVLARNVADLGDLPTMAGWEKLTSDARIAAWTDDYSDIIGALLRKKRGY
jgi:spermidine synthase